MTEFIGTDHRMTLPKPRRMTARPLSRTRAIAAGLLAAVAALALLWAAALVSFGGVDVTVWGSRVRTHEPLRPLAIAAIALVLFVPLYGAVRAHQHWWHLTRRLDDGPMALGLSVFVLIIGLAYSSTAATG